jgi:hypothetical protein
VKKYEQMAESIDEIRESFRAIVAGLVTDGFTDREARVIIAGIYAAESLRDRKDKPK